MKILLLPVPPVNPWPLKASHPNALPAGQTAIAKRYFRGNARKFASFASSLIFFISCFISFDKSYSDDDLSNLAVEKIKFSSKIEKAKIAVLNFLPLPDKLPDKLLPHERVFTGEFYSPKPKDIKFEGVFMPANYQEILASSIKIIKKVYGLDIRVVSSISEIPKNTNYIIFGAVKGFNCSDDKAVVDLNIQIIDGKTYEVVKTFPIKKSATLNEKLSVSQPIHVVGSAGRDFHQQRSLLSALSYSSMLDIIGIIDRI
ncbi:MAG: hypothetical protein A2073_05900 [Deltaproteobacteria bacterium GWC2_42_11]|nr:MAG: hypothetical protein A2073_05900 [Deltaproteobacteria bacterium GWC2_42_11]